MIRNRPLIWLSMGLDLVGILLTALLTGLPYFQNPTSSIQVNGLTIGCVFVITGWFLGGYSFLSWPWLTYRQLMQRWLLVVVTTLAVTALISVMRHGPPTAVWFQGKTLIVLGFTFSLWGLLMRSWLLPLARRQASDFLARSPLVNMHKWIETPTEAGESSPQRQLLLLLVAYHPSAEEVEQLQACLRQLKPEI